jgi:hypothetical protein
MHNNIIAICGAKRSGKDTLANIISSKYGHTHVKIAQKLKDACKILFNFTDDQMELDIKDDIDPKWKTSPRKIMQFMGTEIMQYKIQEILPHVGKKFWINSLTRSFDEGKRYVISDLRFLHEYEELKKKGAIIIKIYSEYDTNSDIHLSEKEFLEIPYDFLIINNKKITNKSYLEDQLTRIL